MSYQGAAKTGFHTFCPSSCLQSQFGLFYKCPAFGEFLLFWAHFFFLVFPRKSSSLPEISLSYMLHFYGTVPNRQKPIKTSEMCSGVKYGSGQEPKKETAHHVTGSGELLNPAPAESLPKDQWLLVRKTLEHLMGPVSRVASAGPCV